MCIDIQKYVQIRDFRPYAIVQIRVEGLPPTSKYRDELKVLLNDLRGVLKEETLLKVFERTSQTIPYFSRKSW